VLAVAAVLRERDELGPRVLALVWFFVGVVVGAAALLWLFTRPAAQQGVASMSTAVIGHNAKLFWHECLPWAIGTKIYKPLHVMDYVPWAMPRAYKVITWIGAASLAISLILSARFAFPRVRAIVAVAWLTIALNIGSFLVSLMVMDHFSMRYLAASILVL